jgi:hypothetical protein
VLPTQKTWGDKSADRSAEAQMPDTLINVRIDPGEAASNESSDEEWEYSREVKEQELAQRASILPFWLFLRITSEPSHFAKLAWGKTGRNQPINPNNHSLNSVQNHMSILVTCQSFQNRA